MWLCTVVYTCALNGKGEGGRKDRFKEVLIEIFICSFSTWMVGEGGGRIYVYPHGAHYYLFMRFDEGTIPSIYPGSFTLHVCKIVSLLCTVAAYLPGFRFSRSLLEIRSTVRPNICRVRVLSRLKASF